MQNSLGAYTWHKKEVASFTKLEKEEGRESYIFYRTYTLLGNLLVALVSLV